MWALHAVKGHDGALRLFACYCARYSLDFFERKYPDDKRPRQSIETAERFARGQATSKELAAAKATLRAALAAACAVCPIADKAAEAAEADFRREFLRLCRLEGEYADLRPARNADGYVPPLRYTPLQ